MTVPIKPELRAHLDGLVAQARATGRNRWDVLNERGLIHTEARRRLERSEAVRRAIDRLDELSVPQIMGNQAYRTGAMTAGDMRKALMERLYEISVAMYEGAL